MFEYEFPMHNDPLSHYRDIWLVDFEFRPLGGREGSRPDVVCLVAHELRSGRTIRLRKEQLGRAVHRTRPMTVSCLSPTTRVPRSAAIWCSAGPFQAAFWTSTPSIGT